MFTNPKKTVKSALVVRMTVPVDQKKILTAAAAAVPMQNKIRQTIFISYFSFKKTEYKLSRSLYSVFYATLYNQHYIVFHYSIWYNKYHKHHRKDE